MINFPFPVNLKVTKSILSAEKAKKRISMNTLMTATTSVYLPRSVSTDLTIRPDSVLTNPIQ